jgi:predicted regulator of Ras-like GTPase activity (Roadblock/LC7/MglB family)
MSPINEPQGRRGTRLPISAEDPVWLDTSQWTEDNMQPHSNLVVSESEQGNIARVLGRLTLDTGASHVLLLDKSGQVISAQGQSGRRDVIALGALLAGAFSSSRQVAEILGERDFRTILQQGVHESMYTSLIGDQWLLVVVFDRQTHVGLVKVLARKAVEELERVLERVRVGGAQAKEQVVNVRFRDSVASTIDALFQD